MQATLREGSLYGPAGCNVSRDETEEPTEPEETDEQSRATEAPAPKGNLRSPTSSQPNATCVGGRGIEGEGKEEMPGAERTGGGQRGKRDDGRLDATGPTGDEPQRS